MLKNTHLLTEHRLCPEFSDFEGFSAVSASIFRGLEKDDGNNTDKGFEFHIV